MRGGEESRSVGGMSAREGVWALKKIPPTDADMQCAGVNGGVNKAGIRRRVGENVSVKVKETSCEKTLVAGR